jgi:hypothetical protein
VVIEGLAVGPEVPTALCRTAVRIWLEPNPKRSYPLDIPFFRTNLLSWRLSVFWKRTSNNPPIAEGRWARHMNQEDFAACRKIIKIEEPTAKQAA